MSRAFIAVCLSALVPVGCGVVASSSEVAEKDHASAAPLALGKPQARELARSMLIRPTDLPQWAKETVKNRQQPASCERLGEPPRRSIMGEAESPIFLKMPERAFVASSTALLKTEAKARKAFALMVNAVRGKRGQACFLTALRRGGAEVGVSFDRLRMRLIEYRLAQRSWGFRWTLRVGGKTPLRKAHLTLVFMQEQQAVGFVLSGRYTQPFARDLEKRLGRLVASRMRLAQEAQRS